MKTKRRLRNVYLTRDFHYKHNGIWIAVCLFLILVANLLWFLAILVHPTATFTPKLAISLTLEMVVACVFVIGLAKFTSHRIAGPFLGLRDVCTRVASGQTDARVRFRSHDGLEELETAFNDMLDTLCGTNPPTEPT